jgi:acetoin utilization deacetylase AcuC-like enzyme
MSISLFTHPDCLRHDTGPGHPEQAARLAAILDMAAAEGSGITVVEAATAPVEALLAVHPVAHLRVLEGTSTGGGGALSLDTVTSPYSWHAVLGATGAVLAALQHAHAGRGHAFAAVRPPGHHALAARAMGFCLVNNVVVAARAAQAMGRARVLIVDWDVHHGNGTQFLVEQDATVRYVSLHQHPWYPGTGQAHERGAGNIFNVPRAPGLLPERYVGDLWQAVVAATDGWTPDLVLLSAGFDAMAGDPLGGFTLRAEDYADLTLRLRTRLPAAPIVALLEGGYIPARLAEGVKACLDAMA